MLFRSLILLWVGLFLFSCTEAPVGTKQRPFTMYFVPSVDAESIAETADEMVKHVSERVSQKLYQGKEKFYVKSAIPTSYIAVIEAFGTGKADFAAFNTFSYILAKDIKKYDIEALLSVVRMDNERTYKAMIIARSDSGINKVEDLAGKKFAYTDPASTSGYILPARLIKEKGIKLGEVVFGQKHDNVVTMVYQGQVDAGAAFYSPPKTVMENGKKQTVLRDARFRVKTQFPDVEKKVKIVAFTQEIPNEPWVIRSTLVKDDTGKNQAIKEAVREALISYSKTDKGKQTLDDLYAVTGLANATDSYYKEIRDLVLSSNLNIEEILNKSGKK